MSVILGAKEEARLLLELYEEAGRMVRKLGESTYVNPEFDVWVRRQRLLWRVLTRYCSSQMLAGLIPPRKWHDDHGRGETVEDDLSGESI